VPKRQATSLHQPCLEISEKVLFIPVHPPDDQQVVSCACFSETFVFIFALLLGLWPVRSTSARAVETVQPATGIFTWTAPADVRI